MKDFQVFCSVLTIFNYIFMDWKSDRASRIFFFLGALLGVQKHPSNKIGYIVLVRAARSQITHLVLARRTEMYMGHDPILVTWNAKDKPTGTCPTKCWWQAGSNHKATIQLYTPSSGLAQVPYLPISGQCPKEEALSEKAGNVNLPTLASTGLASLSVSRSSKVLSSLRPPTFNMTIWIQELRMSDMSMAASSSAWLSSFYNQPNQAFYSSIVTIENRDAL